jgi:hypothetical protein
VSAQRSLPAAFKAWRGLALEAVCQRFSIELACGLQGTGLGKESLSDKWVTIRVVEGQTNRYVIEYQILPFFDSRLFWVRTVFATAATVPQKAKPTKKKQ